jgi:hypothetical protein
LRQISTIHIVNEKGEQASNKTSRITMRIRYNTGKESTPIELEEEIYEH